jgi:hypothetical protein
MTTRSIDNLIALGNENLHFLNNSLTAFDKGQLFEVKRIASTIRTLVHDTNQSHSLIKQIENHPDNKLGVPMIYFDKGGIPKSVPPPTLYIDCHVPRIRISITPEEFGDTFRLRKNREHWWNRMILASPSTDKKIWSRKDLVLKYANKEGGAHVDPVMPTDFIEAQNSARYIGDDYEIGVGYIVLFESGVSLLQSFYNYIEEVKNNS